MAKAYDLLISGELLDETRLRARAKFLNTPNSASRYARWSIRLLGACAEQGFSSRATHLVYDDMQAPYPDLDAHDTGKLTDRTRTTVYLDYRDRVSLHHQAALAEVPDSEQLRRSFELANFVVARVGDNFPTFEHGDKKHTMIG